MAGLQCLKRLWLDDRRRDLATPPDTATRLRLSAGHEVGALARRRWPSGVLVTESPARHARAIENTRSLVDDTEVPAIFEAAFEHGGVRVRVDALVRDGGGFAIFEVKSSSKPKSEHVDDLAIQTWVVDGSGVEVTAVSLAHLNTKHVWPGGDYDASALFSDVDLSAQVFDRVRSVPSRVSGMLEALECDREPEIRTGAHCSRPYRCPFFEHCGREDPAHPILELPAVSERVLAELSADGIRSVADISDQRAASAKLSELQSRVRRAVIGGEPEIEAARLEEGLNSIRFPAAFLDFETFAPVLPRYEGTRPHEVIPFQWSMHVLDANGAVEHREFLWTTATDPRPQFIDSLRHALPSKGSIVVYSPYERTRLAALAKSFGTPADRLFRAFRGREVDLARIVRAGVYHPEFHGSFSLKRVLPALVPGYGYSDLDVRDGGAAAAAYSESVDSHTRVERRTILARQLREYCGRDTEALLRLYEALRNLHDREKS